MNNITGITKRDIFDLFFKGLNIDILWDTQKIIYPYYGRLSELEFLKRLYPLEQMPSSDPRFMNAEGDIWQHTVNNDDYPFCWIFDDDRFPLKNGNDEDFLRFLCEIFHPIVRNEEKDWFSFLKKLNELLRNDGYELYSYQQISNRDIYNWRIYTDKQSPIFVPFSERHKKDILQKKISLSIKLKAREQIFQVLNKYNFTYQETDETGWNYNMTVGDCVFSELRQFYELKCYNDQGEYIPTANMKDFVCKNSPFKVFDIIESFSHHYEDKFISEINTILSLNEMPFYLSKEEGIVSSYDLKLDGKIISSIHEIGLKELLQESQSYFDKNQKNIAVEKIWDAFERLKTYYSPTLDKKKSCIKIISNISHNNVDYEEIFNQEFQELTNIGNRFRIRHHEIGKIEIIDPNYYDYLYHRCLSLIILSIKYL